jgi:hypothetical protein
VSISFVPKSQGGVGGLAYILYLCNEGTVNQLAAVLPSSVTPGTYNVYVSDNATAGPVSPYPSGIAQSAWPPKARLDHLGFHGLRIGFRSELRLSDTTRRESFHFRIAHRQHEVARSSGPITDRLAIGLGPAAPTSFLD